MEFVVLYTHQKAKKHKTWQDGRLVFDTSSNMASLYDDSSKRLERFPLRRSQAAIGVDLESERYLITVESMEIQQGIKEACNASGKMSGPVASGHNKRLLTPLSRHCKKSFHCPRRATSPLLHCHPTVSQSPVDYSLSDGYFGTALSDSKLGSKLVEHVNQRISDGSGSHKENFLFQTQTNTFHDQFSQQGRRCDAVGCERQTLSLFAGKALGQSDGGFSLKFSSQSLPKRDSNSILSLLGMSHKPEPQAQHTAGPTDLESEWNEDDISIGLSTFQSGWHAKSDKLHKFEIDCQDPANDPLWNEPESWQFKDANGHDIQDIEEKKASQGLSVDFVDLERTADRSVPTLTADQFSHTDDDWFSISDSPVESQPCVDVSNSFVPSWSGVSELPGVSPPQRIPSEVFQHGRYKLPKSAKMGIPQRRSVGLHRPSSLGHWLLDGRSSEPVKRDSLSRVRELSDASVQTRIGKAGGWWLTEELHFPSLAECEKCVSVGRHVSIPTTFSDVAEYKRVFIAALQGYLNGVLMSVAQLYHFTRKQANLTSYTAGAEKFVAGGNGGLMSTAPSCSHGLAKLKTVRKDGSNKGRLFYGCQLSGPNCCQFFKWADQCTSNCEVNAAPGIVLQSPDSVDTFFRSKGVVFYCDCELVRNGASFKNGAKKGKKTFKKRWQNHRPDYGIDKHSLHLKLRKKQGSSSYSKGDLWVIAKDFEFAPQRSFLAKSCFFGPSSSGEIEISAINGYSESNWPSGMNVHAILVCNACSELSYIDMLKSPSVSAHTVPILPHLLNRQPVSTVPQCSITGSFRAPLQQQPSTVQLSVSWDEVEQLLCGLIDKYRLNKDQQEALMKCARMVCSSAGEESVCVQLIQGVFGAGKSFLLAVTVIFLIQLFELDESVSSRPRPLSLLIASTTNVAVDRILLNLLDMGFEDFVRVGSARKIAKSVLPYSVHSKETEDSELQDLQNMLKSDLSSADRMNVRKSIDRLKQGENLRRLSAVRVVGATCAACLFSILDKMNFPVLLLDECSQMLEPGSLLPMTRFGCGKLVLVGDPKQLSPPLVGAVSVKSTGLEQTLFDRLVKMGLQPTVLRTQYRCHPVISAISSSLFYDGILINGVTEADRAPIADGFPTLCFYSVSKGREKSEGDGSYYNEKEADFVVTLISALVRAGVDSGDIGVVTLYKSQLRHIQSRLDLARKEQESDKHCPTQWKQIQVSTVDAFQGGEREVIILSCVRTEHIGFIDSDRRMNVALTRSKRHLFIVGNQRILCQNDVWFRVIQHCEAQSNGIQSADMFTQQSSDNAGKSQVNTDDIPPSKRRKPSTVSPKFKPLDDDFACNRDVTS